MDFYKKKGCHILLAGYLESTPELNMDEYGEFSTTITLSRKKSVRNKLGQLAEDMTLSYNVFISGKKALRIKQFGFPGLYLCIEGDLQNEKEIIAEKVSFLDFPEPNETNKLTSFNATNTFYLQNEQEILAGLARIH